MTNDLHDKPGAWKAERNLMLKDARRRRLIALLILLLALGAARGYYPCPGGIGQY